MACLSCWAASNRQVVGALAIALATAGCLRPTPRTTAENPARIDIRQLWQEPVDLAMRDLFHGPGGSALAPDASASYEFVAADRSGYSRGYDVRGPNGMQWSVKLGPEAQPEVVVSRVLWAIGYHQPPTYYVPQWKMTGAISGPQPAGRFRPNPPELSVVADWSWYENEFVATRPFKGLVIANLLLNNWDWKTSNNKVYEVTTSTGGTPLRMYVVQDLGASLGRTTFPAFLKWFPMRGFGQGTRNDVAGFESQGFIRTVSDGRPEFDYRGIHTSLLRILTVDDVVWAARLMAQISDSQWTDAFRAAQYSPDQARRYVTAIKRKIAQGLELSTP